MTKTKKKHNYPPGSLSDFNSVDLRRRAEKKLSSTEAAPVNLSLEQSTDLIHELQVHQIELEMQNEELRTAEAELQRTKSQYFDLYEMAPVGYLTQNEKGVIIEINHCAASLLGSTKNALLQRPLNQFIVPENQDIYYLYMRNIENKKGPYYCELRLLSKNANALWVRIESTVIRNKIDHTVKWPTILSDVSASKQAQEILIESQELLSLVLQANGEALWDWDILNDQIKHNDKWYDILGLTENILENNLRSFTSLIHDDDRANVVSNIQNSLNRLGKSDKYACEYRIRRADGVYFWVSDRGFVVRRNTKGIALRMVGSFIDINERKLAEQQQRLHQQQYEQILKVEIFNQTVAAIAHELNQPLSAAASYSDAAQHLLRSMDCHSEKLQHCLEKNVQHIDLAGKVIHELFKFLNSGKIITTAVDINKIIYKVFNTLDEDKHLGSFTTFYELEKDIPKVQANALQLEKVLCNIIRNGIEAMNNSGQLKGSIVVKVKSASNYSVAQVTISDSGPGISEQTLKNIFEPFYSSKTNGLGMGLSISRSLIEAQGGQLWCQAETEGGATFHLTIPFASDSCL